MSYEKIKVEIGSPKWLELRTKGIGGSDAAAAVGESKWRTPYQLYLEKIGEFRPTNESEPMYWGKVHEPAIINHYSKIHNVAIIQEQAIFKSLAHPFMLYTPDGITDNGKLLEIKTSRKGDGFGKPGTDEVPTDYLLQVQHGLEVMGLNTCNLVVLIGGSEYREYTIQADKSLQNCLIGLESKFWECVESRTEPAIEYEDVNFKYRISKESKIEASDEIVDILQSLMMAKEMSAEIDDKILQYSARIKQFMGENDTLEYLGKTLITWKNTRSGTRFAVERFKQEHEELYKQFLDESVSQRRFLIK